MENSFKEKVRPSRPFKEGVSSIIKNGILIDWKFFAHSIQIELLENPQLVIYSLFTNQNVYGRLIPYFPFHFSARVDEVS